MFRKYLRTIRDAAGWRFLLALAVIVVVGLSEGAGLLLLVPLLQAAGVDTQQGSVAGLSRLVARGFAAVHIPVTVVGALLVYGVVVTIQAFLQEAQTLVSAMVQQSIVVSLRTRLYEAMLGANWLFLSRLRSSDLSHALTGEIDRVGAATDQIMSLAAGALMTLVYIRVSHEAGEAYSRVSTALYAAAHDHLAGAKAAKSYGVEGRCMRIFNDVVHELGRITVRSTHHYARSRAWFTIGSVTTLSVLVLVAIEGLALPTASLLLLVFLFFRLMPRLAAWQQGAQMAKHMLPSLEVVLDLERRCRAAAEPPVSSAKPISLTREVRLDHVSFRYDPAAAFALEDVSLRLAGGTTTAIVGPSGAGKSTVADLVLGLLAPASGAVLIDDQALDANHMAAWRAQIGYVAQDAFLFHDTIRANLRWACPDASDADLDRALHLAAADGFVAALPHGADTIIGDRGMTLSGGERQRLALARALLRNPSLLILDEPTSALDAENEQRIWQAIFDLNQKTTILIITHQLKNVQRADVIHVIDQGRVIESGTWVTLIADRGGRLRQLATVYA
ncbi:MAG: ABC transporter ATP-binding protein [Acidobacteria bacterium]|nr:MAG: ABC transporter ATP-binding protein [Acidobacteriota bacterium]